MFCALVVSPFLRLLAVEVSDAAGLAAALRGSEPITLAEDLNLAGWTPVDFEGTLDGARHSIIGLTGPLFANLSGTVSNLTIDGSSVSGNGCEAHFGPVRRGERLVPLAYFAARRILGSTDDPLCGCRAVAGHCHSLIR